MTNDEFKAWLLGFIMLAGKLPLNEIQINIIQNHANLAHAVDGFLTPENQSIVNNLKMNKCLDIKYLFDQVKTNMVPSPVFDSSVANPADA